MRILFTGGSSFTGFWFASELAAAGHDVGATFTRHAPAEYAGTRRQRIERLIAGGVRPWFDVSFGDDRFINLVREQGPWDLLCHHGADVTNYTSPQFDVLAAVATNTRNVSAVVDALVHAGCRAIVLTGTYFEPDEGAGTQPREAVSSYGLSKGLTWQVLRYWCQARGLRLGKFVLPNPIGPLEEPRLSASLIQAWRRGERPVLRTPNYVRDNAPVPLLAAAYRDVVDRTARSPSSSVVRMNPSGWVETVAEFARRLARAMTPRLGRECDWTEVRPAAYDQPMVRHNTDGVLDRWCVAGETRFWDDVAAFYLAQPA